MFALRAPELCPELRVPAAVRCYYLSAHTTCLATSVARTAVAALLAAGALGPRAGAPCRAGRVAWLAVFDEEDWAEFFDELCDELAVTEDPQPRFTLKHARVAPPAVGSTKAGTFPGVFDRPGWAVGCSLARRCRPGSRSG